MHYIILSLTLQPGICMQGGREMHLGIPMKIASWIGLATSLWAVIAAICIAASRPVTPHPPCYHPPSSILSIQLMPLFVSRPSPSLLAFVARNLVFIGFLGLNFNLVLARKPDLCTSRSLATLWHTYIRYGMVCYGMVWYGMPGAPPTRRFIRVTACALLLLSLSCHCPHFFLFRFQLQSG